MKQEPVPCSSTVVYVASISRNLMAIMFLYLAIYYLIKKKLLPVIVYMLLSVITHFSVIMWVVVVICGWVLRNVRIKPWVMICLLVGSFVLSNFFSKSMQIEMMMIDLFEGADVRYSQYAFANINSISTGFGKMALGEALAPFFMIAYSIVLFLLNKKQGFEYYVLFVLIILLVYFMNTSMVFVCRIMMLLPLFWGLNIVSVYKMFPQKRLYIRIMSLIGVLFVLLNFYTSRYVFDYLF